MKGSFLIRRNGIGLGSIQLLCWILYEVFISLMCGLVDYKAICQSRDYTFCHSDSGTGYHLFWTKGKFYCSLDLSFKGKESRRASGTTS